MALLLPVAQVADEEDVHSSEAAAASDLEVDFAEVRGLQIYATIYATPPALKATQGQMDGFFSSLPYKCHQNRVASVGD